jgi:septum site-determining protein MinC
VKSSVVLKSFPKGISVIMDDTIPYEELLDGIAAKFQEADGFLRDASVAVSLDGRSLTPVQEKEIVDTITKNSHLKVLCLIGKDGDKKLKFLDIQDGVHLQRDENCGQFYRGSLRNGQSIETERSIIILGDVDAGSKVYSNKDIVVLGTLCGHAYAGVGGSDKHFVAALGMKPKSLRIGDATLKRGIRMPKASPMIAYTYMGDVLMKKITDELLDNFIL